MQANDIRPEFSWSLFVWQMLILATLIFMIYCLRNISKHQFEGNHKVLWTLIVIFLPLIGSLLYLFIGRKKIKQDDIESLN